MANPIKTAGKHKVQVNFTQKFPHQSRSMWLLLRVTSMTMPTPPRTLLRIGVGFVVAGGLLASVAVPASAAVAIPAAGAQFILTNMMPVSGPPTPAERSASVVAARTIGYPSRAARLWRASTAHPMRLGFR